MRHKVIVSDRAKEMLITHIRFLAHVNKTASVKLKTRLVEEIRALEDMPLRYPFFN